ncbi:MAG: helix-turn-helix transcriptional regulator [Bdellovibrionales bacterium]
MKHFSITPPLAKAARALLEWHQTDLAKAAHLSLATINNFERKAGATRDDTLIAIQAAFEEHGVEFLPGGGLRCVDEVAEVIRFTGKTKFISDWTYYTMRKPLPSGSDFLVSSYDETLWYHPHHLQSTKDFHAWIQQSGLKLKALISDNNKSSSHAWHVFRAIPSEMIGKITYCIYGHEIAFVLWKKHQVIILHNAAVAETFRNQFNYLWKMGKPFG